MQNKQFIQIEELSNQGKYEEALKEISIIEQSGQMPDNDLLTVKYLKSNLYNNLMKHEDALEVTRQLQEESKALGNHLRELDAIINAIKAFQGLNKVDQGMEKVVEGEKLVEELSQKSLTGVKERKASIFLAKGRLYYDRKELDLAQNSFKESLSLREELEDKEGIAWAQYHLGLVDKNKEEFDQALELLQDCLHVFNTIGNRLGIAWSNYQLGAGHLWKGDLNIAQEYLQKSLDIFEEIRSSSGIAWSTNRLGVAHNYKGNLGLAQEYYQKSLIIFKKIKDHDGISGTLNNIGTIFFSKGEPDQAIKYFQRVLKIDEKRGYENIGKVLNNIGESYRDMGNFRLAIDYFEKALHSSRTIKRSDGLTAEVLFQLIRIPDVTLSSNTTKSYLNELREINERQNRKDIDQKYRLAKAFVLKRSNRLRDKVTAQTIFQEVAEEEIAKHELTVYALLNLCEAQLYELETTGNELLLKEVKKLVNKLQIIAEKQQSYWLFAETYLLNSKLSLIELDTQKSLKLLTQAQILAEAKGLQRLVRKLSQERDILESQMDQWRRFIESNVPLRERLKLVQMGSLIDHMLYKGLYYREDALIEYAAKAQRIVEKMGNK